MIVNISYETIGIKGTLKLPGEVWNNTNTWKVKLTTTEELTKVEIDAEKFFRIRTMCGMQNKNKNYAVTAYSAQL